MFSAVSGVTRNKRVGAIGEQPDQKPAALAFAQLEEASRNHILSDAELLICILMQSTLKDWQDRVCAFSSAEAAVVAKISALGVPSIPIHADSVEGNALLSRSSYVSPMACRSSASLPPFPSTSVHSTTFGASLPQLIDSGACAGAVDGGGLLMQGIARCRFVPHPMLFCEL
jgi:hypothetical protein